MAVSLNKNSFSTFTCYPFFAPKPTLARIVFLRQGEQLVARKGTHNVKFCTENQTKTIILFTRTWETACEARTLTTRVIVPQAAHGQRRQQYGNKEVIYQFRLTLPTTSSKIRQAICSTTHKICTSTDKPIGAKSEDYFILKVLFRSS